MSSAHLFLPLCLSQSSRVTRDQNSQNDNDILPYLLGMWRREGWAYDWLTVDVCEVKMNVACGKKFCVIDRRTRRDVTLKHTHHMRGGEEEHLGDDLLSQ